MILAPIISGMPRQVVFVGHCSMLQIVTYVPPHEVDRQADERKHPRHNSSGQQHGRAAVGERVVDGPHQRAVDTASATAERSAGWTDGRLLGRTDGCWDGRDEGTCDGGRSASQLDGRSSRGLLGWLLTWSLQWLRRRNSRRLAAD